MRHFILMNGFAIMVAIIFGTVGRDTNRERFQYGLKIFFEFIGVGFGLACVLYWIP